jgi:exosortase/archaeosortase family protein
VALANERLAGPLIMRPDVPAPSARRRRVEAIAGVVLFVLIYGGLLWAYQGLRDSWAGAWLIDRWTVAPAARAIQLVLPADGVQAWGSRLVWPGGQLRLLAGCDGFEVLAVFTAAVLAAPLAVGRALTLLAAGCSAVWLLNQLRIVALYAAYRHRPDWFDALHTVWGPLLMIAVLAPAFAWALRRSRDEATT